MNKPRYITRDDVDRPKFDLKRPDEHIPMFTETQSMVDYKYDPNQFRSVWVPKKVKIELYNTIMFWRKNLDLYLKVQGAKNLFHSHLDPHLHPYAIYDDDDAKTSSYAQEFSDKTSRAGSRSVPAPQETISKGKSYDFTGEKSVVS